MGGAAVCLFTTLSRYLRRHTCQQAYALDCLSGKSEPVWMLPAEDGHGFPFIAAGQQSVHIIVKHSQRHLLTHSETAVWL